MLPGHTLLQGLLHTSSGVMILERQQSQLRPWRRFGLPAAMSTLPYFACGSHTSFLIC